MTTTLLQLLRLPGACHTGSVTEFLVWRFGRDVQAVVCHGYLQFPPQLRVELEHGLRLRLIYDECVVCCLGTCSY